MLKINCLNHITVKYIGHHELMNSFYKTEAAIFPHRLCYLTAFPLISLIQVSTHLRLFLFKIWTPSVYCFQTSYKISAVLKGPYSHITGCSLINLRGWGVLPGKYCGTTVFADTMDYIGSSRHLYSYRHSV